MELEQLTGYWILNRREQKPAQDEQIQISLFGKSYSFNDPQIEILNFLSNNNKCYHLGINRLPLGNSEEFEIHSFLPGTYDLLAKTIALLEPWCMSIMDDNLIIIEESNDYKSEEEWIRLTADHENLIDFLNVEFEDS